MFFRDFIQDRQDRIENDLFEHRLNAIHFLFIEGVDIKPAQDLGKLFFSTALRNKILSYSMSAPSNIPRISLRYSLGIKFYNHLDFFNHWLSGWFNST